MAIRVKPEFAKEVIGFNNSSKPLGERDDLHKLVEDALASHNQNILNKFEEIPTEDELMQAKEAAFNKKQQAKKNEKQGE